MTTLLCTTAARSIGADEGLTRPTPVTDPSGWITVKDYPDEALAARQQGPVSFELSLNAAGKVVGCRIVTSSGSPSLDARTCSLLAERAVFAPAAGPATRIYASRVRWVLPQIVEPPPAAPPKPIEMSGISRSGMGAADLYVDEQGLVTRCEQAPKPYANILAPPSVCGAYPIGSRFGPPATNHGRPTKRKVRIQISVDETPQR